MWHKRILFIVLIAISLSAAALWYSNSVVTKSAAGKTFDDIQQVPNVRVGLLLGTSKLLKNGRENLYFKYRIKAATELLENGKIKYLIISGDNGNSAYDEPTDMKNALIDNGVDSTKLYLDYAGFRTFDSMVRVKEIFGQDKILVISQKFHNERAIYIAEQLRLKAIGFNAQDVQKYYGIKTSIREKFARVKVVLDFWLGVKPKFLGEKIRMK
jgi:SanA protein